MDQSQPMPLKLNNHSVSPPGGWSYRVAETGQRFRNHPTPESLRRALASHCKLHNLPLPTDAQIEDQLCKALGPAAADWCVDSESGEAQRAYPGMAACTLTFTQVLSATRTLFSWLVKGRKRVEGAEAERRARICSTCTENQIVHGCTSCSMPALKEAVNQVVAGGTTTVDGALNGCCICGCSLKALVWLPLDLLQARMPAAENARLPAHCWKKLSL